jgi:phosphate starvation-inducible protein PhoH and related proteins
MTHINLEKFSKEQLQVLLGRKYKGAYKNLKYLEEQFAGVHFNYKVGEYLQILGNKTPDIFGEEAEMQVESVQRILTKIDKLFLIKQKPFKFEQLEAMVLNMKTPQKKPNHDDNSLYSGVKISDPRFVRDFMTHDIVRLFNKEFGMKIEAGTSLDKIKVFPKKNKGNQDDNLKVASEVIRYHNQEYKNLHEEDKSIRLKDVVESIRMAKAGKELVIPVVDKKAENLTLTTFKGRVTPKDASQVKAIQALQKNKAYTIIGGPQASGKTFIAVAYAVSELRNKKIDKIVLTRPTVEAGENLGFLPGDQKQKLDPYLQPLYDLLEETMGANDLANGLRDKTIEIAPLAFMRGRTIKRAFIIADEMQNATDLQIKMLGGRPDPTSRIAFTGDVAQNDRTDGKSGLAKLMHVMDGAKHAEVVMLEGNYRHPAVEELNQRYEEYEANHLDIVSIHKKIEQPSNDNINPAMIAQLAAATLAEMLKNSEIVQTLIAAQKLQA